MARAKFLVMARARGQTHGEPAVARMVPALRQTARPWQMKTVYTDRLMRLKPFVLPVLLVSILGIGWLDFVTGPRISFALIYLLPILFSGWSLGFVAAWIMTGCTCLAQFLADIAWDGQSLNPTAMWNLFTRVSMLGALGHLTAWVARDRQRLDELLRERTSAHAATVEQLRHRDRLALVGQIASGIAHELAAPLNVITGRARLLLEPDVTSTEVAPHARSIVEQGERVTSTIRQLLDFARRRGPELGDTDLHKLSQRVLELIRPLATKRRVKLVLLPAEGDCITAVDLNQIQQALTNLILNAVQAMPQGGTVEVSVRAEATACALSVRDTGTGIAPEIRGRIFEPFFTTQRAGEGTGLGLSITEGIVRDHGGTIEVESTVGVGSRFILRLPRRTDAQVAESLT